MNSDFAGKTVFDLSIVFLTPYRFTTGQEDWGVTETIPGTAALKCSQPSPIMPLHHICKAILVLLYHPYVMHF